ncbi:Cthe_2314 family HEPN domain-containing protein, partial [Staphylococcus sp. GDY8P68P]
WVFYYHNIALHFLHTLHDLMYTLVRELTHSYEVKLELGFKRELVAKLKSSDNETFNKLGNILNKNSPIRTVKYRDEYTHNITPYRLNSHPEKDEHGNAFFKANKPMINDIEEAIKDIESDLEKLQKKAKHIKTALTIL